MAAFGGANHGRNEADLYDHVSETDMGLGQTWAQTERTTHRDFNRTPEEKTMGPYSVERELGCDGKRIELVYRARPVRTAKRRNKPVGRTGPQGTARSQGVGL